MSPRSSREPWRIEASARRGAKPELNLDVQRIAAIDGLRGFAVLLVFCVHFFSTFVTAAFGVNFDDVASIFELSGTLAIGYWLFYSHYGVFLFFCISGFVIARALSRVSTTAQWRRFMTRRLLRIYPAFLVSLVLACALAVWIQGSTVLGWRTIAGNLLFLNGWFALNVHAYNNVSWSLFFEFIFYVVYSALHVLMRQAGRGPGTAPALWLVFIVSLGIAGYQEWFLFIPFGAGVIAASVSAVRMQRWVAATTSDGTTILLYIALTSFSVVVVALPQRGPAGLIWPSLSALWLLVMSVVFTLLVLRVAYGAALLARVFSWPLLAWFGRISFSFFLVHSLVITLVFNMYRYMFGALSPPMGLVLGALVLSLATALSALMYRYIEVPAMGLLRSRQVPANAAIW